MSKKTSTGSLSEASRYYVPGRTRIMHLFLFFAALIVAAGMTHVILRDLGGALVQGDHLGLVLIGLAAIVGVMLPVYFMYVSILSITETLTIMPQGVIYQTGGRQIQVAWEAIDRVDTVRPKDRPSLRLPCLILETPFRTNSLTTPNLHAADGNIPLGPFLPGVDVDNLHVSLLHTEIGQQIADYAPRLLTD